MKKKNANSTQHKFKGFVSFTRILLIRLYPLIKSLCDAKFARIHKTSNKHTLQKAKKKWNKMNFEQSIRTHSV